MGAQTPYILGERRPIHRRSELALRGDDREQVSDVCFEPLQRTGPSLETHSRGLIDAATETAEQMLVQARQACTAEFEAARKAGYDAGFSEGRADADNESAGLLAAAEAIATNVARERDELLARQEQEIVELALHIAEKVINAQVAADPNIVLEVCRGAMRKAFQRDSLTVLAHPDDLALLREAGPRVASQLGGIHNLDFVEERRVSRGGVVVRTPAGEIDATLASKLETLATTLREVSEESR